MCDMYHACIGVTAGMFSWMSSIGKINDAELHRMVGMDHYVLLRHCLFGFNLTFMSVTPCTITMYYYVLIISIVYHDHYP